MICNNLTVLELFNKLIFAFREYHLKYEELVIPGRNVSDILEIVFKNYDKRIRPFYGGNYDYLNLIYLLNGLFLCV